ncbi:MAG: alanine racemase [Bacteroidota bacterium]
MTNSVSNSVIVGTHPTQLIISKDALIHNLTTYRDHLSNGTKIMAMIKAFGYGNGDVELARIMEESGLVEYLGVAYVNEGIALREDGISLPIMVMNPGIIDLEDMVAFNIEPTVYTPEQLSQLIEMNPQDMSQVEVHVKIDSGMHRLGFHHEEIKEAAQKLLDHNVKVVGVYTHLASSPEPENDDYTHEQVAYFNKGYEMLTEVLGYKPMRHILNSAGIVRFKEYQYEMVRAGMGIYGVEPSGVMQDKFKPIGSLVTEISQINKLKKGDTVGYVRRGKIEKEEAEIAVLPLGYADGYNRLFSNGNAHVYVKGQRVPVVGNVCMDMIFIDVTGMNCKIGDKVELFGENITVKELAKAANTIEYEIFTSIGARVERVYK